jgi:hypothetical protein
MEEKKWKPEEANTSDTGSLRYNKGKPEIHQVPPQLVRGAAEGFVYGQQKYGKWNYAKGNNYSVPYDSLRRHLDAFFWEGNIDKESQLHHLKLAAANLAMLMLYVEKFPEMDDRPLEFKNDKK